MLKKKRFFFYILLIHIQIFRRLFIFFLSLLTNSIWKGHIPINSYHRPINFIKSPDFQTLAIKVNNNTFTNYKYSPKYFFFLVFNLFIYFFLLCRDQNILCFSIHVMTVTKVSPNCDTFGFNCCTFAFLVSSNGFVARLKFSSPLNALNR